MKVEEFFKQNSDILIAPITEEEFQKLTDGTVIFVITCYDSKLPQLERTIRSVGYQMVVCTCRNRDGSMTDITTLALTQKGYAKLDYVCQTDIQGLGSRVAFRCNPLPLGDRRQNHHWVF